MSWLSEIICGVIFDETLCKADTPAPTCAVDRDRGGHTSELSLAHCERSSGFVIWYSVDDPESGKQICRRRSLI
jgi:hypothetical protein